jgi:hypothetical protein
MFANGEMLLSEVWIYSMATVQMKVCNTCRFAAVILVIVRSFGCKVEFSSSYYDSNAAVFSFLLYAQ